MTALERALAQATPTICNSDQGSHFTSPQYRQLLQAAEVKISMDGKGRALDNIFTERLWRTIKSEPLSPEAKIEAGDDASHVQWYPIENLQKLPELAFNHIRLLRMALRQLFTSYYHEAVGIQAIETCQCEIEHSTGLRCANTAYWRYNGIAICPRHIELAVQRNERKALVSNAPPKKLK